MQRFRNILLLAVIPLLFFIAAKNAPADSKSSPPSDHITMNAQDIADLFNENCASCHGRDGKGATRAGRRAGVKDFTNSTYQASFTDAQAIQVVKTAKKNGEQLRGKKPFADKLSDTQIRQLVQYVRTFAS